MYLISRTGKVGVSSEEFAPGDEMERLDVHYSSRFTLIHFFAVEMVNMT